MVNSLAGPPVVSAPTELWRVGRAQSPLTSIDYGPLDMGESSAGNRFDSANGTFKVSYYGTTLHACFGESLAPFRPKGGLAELVKKDWDRMWAMEAGAVPSDWRHRRRALRCRVATSRSFLNVESREVITALDGSLQAILQPLDIEHLDVAVLRGPDRRITRVLSDYVWSQKEGGRPRFAGIRYLSRHNSDWECWAVFEGTPVESLEALPIECDMPELQEVAKAWGFASFDIG
jgi:hypothetical protein